MRASEIICKSLLGEYYKPVQLGRFTFNLYPPTIKQMVQIFNGSDTTINENTRRFEVIANAPVELKGRCRSLAVAIYPDSKVKQWLCRWYIWHYATVSQINEASHTLAAVIQGTEAFEAVAFDQARAKSKVEVIGNSTIAGVIATFIDGLHLSFDEVYEKIPYASLLLMSVDKLRPVYDGDVMKEVSEEEFFKNKKK